MAAWLDTNMQFTHRTTPYIQQWQLLSNIKYFLMYFTLYCCIKQYRVHKHYGVWKMYILCRTFPVHQKSLRNQTLSLTILSSLSFGFHTTEHWSYSKQRRQLILPPLSENVTAQHRDKGCLQRCIHITWMDRWVDKCVHRKVRHPSQNCAVAKCDATNMCTF